MALLSKANIGPIKHIQTKIKPAISFGHLNPELKIYLIITCKNIIETIEKIEMPEKINTIFRMYLKYISLISFIFSSNKLTLSLSYKELSIINTEFLYITNYLILNTQSI